jgi:hypothetical protein
VTSCNLPRKILLNGKKPQVQTRSNSDDASADSLRYWGFEEVCNLQTNYKPYTKKLIIKKDKRLPPRLRRQPNPQTKNPPNRCPRTSRTNRNGHNPLGNFYPARLATGRDVPNARRVRDSVWVCEACC